MAVAAQVQAPPKSTISPVLLSKFHKDHQSKSNTPTTQSPPLTTTSGVREFQASLAHVSQQPRQLTANPTHSAAPVVTKRLPSPPHKPAPLIQKQHHGAKQALEAARLLLEQQQEEDEARLETAKHN